MTTITEALSDFAVELKYDEIPEKVIEQAKLCLLDYLGVTLAGSQASMGKTLVSLTEEFKGSRESSIIGKGTLVPCPNAAFVNGAVGHIHELDDGHRFALGHLGVTVIPAALAVAEKEEVGGKELITAVVIGYELFSKIARAVNPSHRSRGFHTTGTCGTFGAAVAAGKILDLDKRKMTSALGIAATQAAGLMEVMVGESEIKPLNPGRAAQCGVLAALLAARGISAPHTMLEGENGFCRAYSDESDLKSIVVGLGQDFEIMGVYFKLHAACRHAHPAIDSTLELVRKYNLTASDIHKINVKTYSAAYKLVGRIYEPETVSTAKFSVPYCLAAAIKEGNVGPDVFTIEKIKNKELLNLAEKVRVEVDAEIDRLAPEKRGAAVEIVTKEGTKYEWEVENPKGEPENPVSTNELTEKFKNLSRPVLSHRQVDSLIEIVNALDSTPNIKLLTKLLYP